MGGFLGLGRTSGGRVLESESSKRTEVEGFEL